MNYKQGDLLIAFKDDEVNVIMHQCNCTVGMGAGIAKEIAREFPIVNLINDELLDQSDIEGKCYPIAITNKKYIVNLYSQYYPGAPSEREILFGENKGNLDTFRQRLNWLRKSLKMYVEEYSNKDDIIGLPLIASGLAADKNKKNGLSDLEYFKKYIAPTIEEELQNFNVTVYYL